MSNFPFGGRASRRRRRGAVRLMVLAGVLLGLTAYGTPWLEHEWIDIPGLGTRPETAQAAVRVIDGDTFVYGEERIRIADIDTPELRGRCPEEKALARRATRRLDDLLAAGPFELHRVGRDEDRYGRKLRVVTRDGRSLGDVLVSEGLARTWSGRREPWCV
ncbi:thermonuclease family protein [Sphingomonas parva]|uniref:Thermonuclease family protein n=1 Tax=Sphingomonas parva TaxID=2555898 RepID=A0A4Y8ZPN7_9SPHN|nr:thermonuclease family protein [Sphingomonas parva]TFI57980.1 thermonuclease family protein [Sphingomonas parva]